MFEFHINDAAYEYLYIQRGEIAAIKEREPWQRAYDHSIDAIYQSVKDYIPIRCTRTLDIGSGLGGINAVFNRHVGGGLRVELLDGLNDAPKVIQHRRTFNDMDVARDFLDENGVTYLTTHHSTETIEDRFDLITSFASWCFHYPPEGYLAFVKNRVHAHSVIMIDVRKNPTFLSLLFKEFGSPIVVAEGKKFERHIYHMGNRND